MDNIDIDNKWAQVNNPSTSSEELAKLAKDEDNLIQYRAACNPSTPAEALIELATHKSVNVRWAVALNPNTPIETMAALVIEEGWMVKGAVLQNPNCPEAIKLWFKIGGYAGMTLAEFMAGTNDH